MLVEARISSENASAVPTFGESMNEPYQPDDGLLDSPSVVATDELDVGGSEFSWSSVGSGPSPSAADEGSTSAAELGSGAQAASVTETTPLYIPISTDASNQGQPQRDEQEEYAHRALKLQPKKHALYFWDVITFHVRFLHGSVLSRGPSLTFT
jgi:hypothetical protein